MLAPVAQALSTPVPVAASPHGSPRPPTMPPHLEITPADALQLIGKESPEFCDCYTITVDHSKVADKSESQLQYLEAININI